MFELVLRAPQALVEPLSETLADELDALAVTVEDADAGTADEQALFGEPGLPAAAAGWQRSTVRALFESERAAEAAAASVLAQPRLRGDAANPGAHIQALQAVPERDWVRLTQAQFAPMAITPGFWIVPSWHQPPPGATTVIRMDPGLAFGTGTHPTTRMCLRWLATQAPTHAAHWSRVLDYGCGSGILAIAAAKLGAQAVHAVDIDPAALEATRSNAQRNGVTLTVAPPEAVQGGYAVVLANILATPLELLAPLLAGQLAAQGQLLLAGLLERQADRLRAAYAPWLAIDVLDVEEGWALMGGRSSMPAAAAKGRHP
jgi:ribosomal protein L11 methyltransferase